MNRLLFSLVMAIGFVLGTGCETAPEKAKAPGEGQLFEVKVEYTGFYRSGPQQRGGPDLSLREGRIVRMLKRSFGYSMVELEDGTSGYVATEDLKVSAAPDFGGGGGSMLLGLPDEPIQSSAIVEQYRIGEEPGAPALELNPTGVAPEPLLPDGGLFPGAPTQPLPSPVPSTPPPAPTPPGGA